MDAPLKISLLLPVFNEEKNISEVYNALAKVFAQMPGYTCEIVFANDGSTDGTLDEIKTLTAAYDNVFYVSLSRNFGKDHALMAGLHCCTGEAVITMDGDLQHPPALISAMLQYWKEGYEVVYAYREEKNMHAGALNRGLSHFFYRLINRLSDVNLENGISDFRLIDRKVAGSLLRFKEDDPFFRGLLKWVGFRQKAIPYTPGLRHAGETKYNLRALMRLGLYSVTSFSTKPLTYAIYIGFFFALASMLYIPYVIYSLYTHVAISGWASTIVTIAFFGGLQLMIMGILGIYLGKVFLQAKERPSYIISESKVPGNE